MSPWRAVPGSQKKLETPILDKVAETFLAINPDFPTPAQITLPLQLLKASTAFPNEELKILSETNDKFLEENQMLKSQLNDSDKKILKLRKEIDIQKKEIVQNAIDQNELIFLRLNLIHSSKCKKTAFKKGYKVGTKEYKECILRKGKKSSD